MTIQRQLRLSFRAQCRRPLRAALALATIAAGVAVIVITAAMSAGARRQIAGSLERVGTNLLIVRPAAIAPTVARPDIRGAATTLTIADADALRVGREVELVAPASDRRVRARSVTAAAPASVIGTTASFQRIRNLVVSSGRFIIPADDLGAARVAVLGARVARVLFGADAVGQTIILGRAPFDVVGVLQAKGAAPDGSDQDGQVLVPITTAMRRLNNVTSVNEIFVRARRQDEIDRARQSIAEILADRHERIDFEVQNTASLIASQNRTAESLDAISESVAVATFAIGGGGIVALMLLTTTERTAEIGLRIAVGATRRDIVLQFMTEAAALSVGGWLIGAIAGAIASTVAARILNWSIALPSEAVMWSLLVATAGGVAAGVVPAERASRVPPMRALISR